MIEIDEDLFKDIMDTPWLASITLLVIILERKGKATSFLKIKSKPRVVPKQRKTVKKVRTWSEFNMPSPDENKGSEKSETPDKRPKRPKTDKAQGSKDIDMTPDFGKGKGEKSSLA